MDIALDTRITFYNNSGISRYIDGLLTGIAANPEDFSYTQYRSLRDRSASHYKGRFQVSGLITPPHWRWEKTTLPLELRGRSHGLIHALDFFVPPMRNFPVVSQLYDLYFLRNPTAMDAGSQRHYQRLKEFSSSIAHFICCSEATKKDALDLLGVPDDSVTVVYPGFVAEDFIGLERFRPAGTRFGLEKGIILSVGTIEPRKNLPNLFSAYKELRSQLGTTTPPLVLVGRKGFRADEILSQIKSLELESSILYLGEVTQAELKYLYSIAQIVAYVSLYEGFGFPVLEGMAAGCVVLASDSSSIPEVAGDAALLVNPLSVESICDGLTKLLGSHELRQQLIEKGKMRANCFPWRKTAAETIAVYRKVLGAKAVA